MGLELGLEGKVAIVTGGSAGIGLACSRALFREGAKVVVAARTADRLAAAKEEVLAESGGARGSDLIAVRADLTDPGDIETITNSTVGAFGRIDILVNNAGAARGGDFEQLSDDDFLSAWELKLLGYIRMVRSVLPQMKSQRDGRIVNIIGGAARTPRAVFLPGGTANAAILNFTKGISKELAQYGIRVNAVSPGTTATERAVRLAEQEASARKVGAEEVMKERLAAIPLGRMTEPSEIAAMVLLLTSDLLPSMTGAEVLIDGGLTPGL